MYAPTLTGLGKRSHLVNDAIDLDTHVTYVVNLLFYEDLTDLVLVGHSYGGIVIKGVAGRATDRVGALVYLDAAHIEDGQKVSEVTPVLVKRRAESQMVNGAELFAFPDEALVRAYGVTDPEDVEWVARRLTPHPWKTVDQPLLLTNEAAIDAIPDFHIIATRFVDGITRNAALMTAARAGGRTWE